MPALPNPGMSFTPFDPLPASDLNDIVENIESLHDGSGVLYNNNQELGWKNSSGTEKKVLRLDDDNYLRLSQIPFKAMASNSTREDVLIQHGWGAGLGNNTSATTLADVTFPISYGNNNPPIIMISTLGYKNGAAPTTPSDANSGAGFYFVAAPLANGTGFSPSILSRDAASPNTPTTYHMFAWVAIGTKA